MSELRKIKRLPDGELEVMMVIWAEEKPVSASYILHKLEGQRKWALSSLMTVLSRLREKGFVSCQKEGGHNSYHSLIGVKEYKHAEGSAFFKKLYDSSLTDLVTTLYHAKSINNKDLKELRTFLDDLEQGEK